MVLSPCCISPLFRSVPYEKRMATILDWLRLPEGERYDGAF